MNCFFCHSEALNAFESQIHDDFHLLAFEVCKQKTVVILNHQAA